MSHNMILLMQKNNQVKVEEILVNKFDLLRSAYIDLRKNKIRSALTTLGIIIGVSSVISISGLSASAAEVVKGKLFSYGKNAVRFYQGDKQWATETDLINLKQQNPNIKYITPLYEQNIYDVKSIYYKLNMSRLQATTNDYFFIKEMKLSSGRLFSNTEILSASRVAIIGNTVKEALFDKLNPLGMEITINNVPFKVIGVSESSGTSIGGKDFDNFIAIPYNRISSIKNQKILIEQIYASTEESIHVDLLKNNILKYFRSKFHILPGNDHTQLFRVSTSQDKLEIANYVMSALKWLMVAVASIALFVGGVGIMNIMLASVNERIREVGLRMAIGAKKRDILLQFLSESVVLSVIGGSIGIVVGLISYAIIVYILKWPFILSVFSIIISYFFSAAVGIFFGFYPAKKASEMLPIEALKHV
ncbi:MAG TPA: ABC transporter permease [Spirochaetota bacterium]|nr:ABC transporter permease [Spirochaetota bacterium]HOR43355.1 ABC transporter permease [Spirochaetota bacterium]HPK54896.1 ABC transporter permease [Spirochaetota bacterium]